MPKGYKHTPESIQKIKDARSKQVFSDKSNKKRSESLKGRKRPVEVCEKIRRANTGKKLAEDIKRKISQTKSGVKQTPEQIDARRKGLIGNVTSDETKKKIRKSCIKYIETCKLEGGQMYPKYNKSSIPILEQKAKELGITDLQHAENGGEYYIRELGYWVDGYSKEKNIVIEYYEKFHERNKERDNRRQREIEDFLKCKFVIINEK